MLTQSPHFMVNKLLNALDSSAIGYFSNVLTWLSLLLIGSTDIAFISTSSDHDVNITIQQCSLTTADCADVSRTVMFEKEQGSRSWYIPKAENSK
jgi:hypothetical protein